MKGENKKGSIIHQLGMTDYLKGYTSGLTDGSNNMIKLLTKWTSVEEKLPDMCYGAVLCMIDNDPLKIQIGLMSLCSRWIGVKGNVTHWRPIWISGENIKEITNE